MCELSSGWITVSASSFLGHAETLFALRLKSVWESDFKDQGGTFTDFARMEIQHMLNEVENELSGLEIAGVEPGELDTFEFLS